MSSPKRAAPPVGQAVLAVAVLAAVIAVLAGPNIHLDLLRSSPAEPLALVAPDRAIPAAAALLAGLSGLAFYVWRHKRLRRIEDGLRSSEERFRLMVDALPFPVAVTRIADGIVLYANAAAIDAFGAQGADVGNERAGAFYVNPSDREAVLAELSHGVGVRGREVWMKRRDGKPFWALLSCVVTSYGTERAVLSTIIDNAAQKETLDRVTLLNRLLRTISEINQLIVREKDPARVLSEACRITVECGEFRMAWIGRADTTSGAVKPLAWAGAEDGYLSEGRIHSNETPHDSEPHGTAIREGRAEIVQDAERETRMAPWLAEFRRRGFRSAAAFPFEAGGLRSALCVYAADPGVFVPEVTALLEELANDIGFALESIETERLRTEAETALAASEARYRLLFENNPLPMWVYDMETLAFLAVNDAAVTHYGFSREEFLQMTLKEIRPAQELEGLRHSVTAGGAAIRHPGVFRHRRKDGSLIEVDITTHDIEFGSRMGRLVLAQDVTDERRSKWALEESEARFSAFMDALPAAAFIRDGDSRTLYANRMMRDFVGKDIVGKRTDDYFEAEVAKARMEEDRRALQEGPSVILQELRNADGQPRVLRAHKFPIHLPDRPPLLGGIAIDITEQVRSGEEIRRLNEELEERVRKRTMQLEAVNQELEAFSYSVSHDLRAPLRAIDGFSHRVLTSYENQIDDEGKRLLGVIRTNTVRMSQLIDDLLSLSRAGRQEIRRSRLDMSSHVEQLFQELIEQDPSPPAELRLQSLPPAYGDLTLVRQVLTNLLSNALKFSSKRERRIVEVGSHLEGDETVFFVRDNGAGFDMKYAGKLFGVFQRLHGQTEFSGTGVGLAIVERIIKRLDGRVWAKGELGAGATFFFTLPSTGDRS